MDLSNYIDLSSSDILNAQGTLNDVFHVSNNEEEVAGALKGVSSECDPQLLINLHFKEPIKLASIKFLSSKSDTAPRKVKLFVNKLNLGFSEAEDQAATQELTLKANDSKASADPASSATKLLTAKFAKVSNLTIFIADNQSDGESTTLDRIWLFGASQSGAPPTNVKTINSPLEYNQYVKNSPGKSVVAYFHAPWCSHCRTVGPLIQKLSMQSTEIVFLSIDIDKLKNTLPEAQEIQGVPHFKIYKDGVKIHEQSGVPDLLQNMLPKFEYDEHDSTPGANRDGSGL